LQRGSSFQKTFNEIVKNSQGHLENPNNLTTTKARLDAVGNNSNIAQCRAFVALERYICYKNGVTGQIPNNTDDNNHAVNAWNYNQAIDSLKYALTLPSNYLLVDGSDFVNGDGVDQVKFTRALMNMARALDLYLALEIAFDHYGETDYGNTSGGRLLTGIQKHNLESAIKQNMDDLHTYLYDKAYAFFTKSIQKVEAGNRPLKIFVAMGYAALTMQACDYTGPQQGLLTVGASPVFADCHTYLDEAFRAAGDQAASERLDYWSYQTDNGAHFWAEGPYYLNYALMDVVPFWHAIRAVGFLNYNNHNISDLFKNGWFMNPLDWLADLSTGHGELPPIDDSNKYPIYAASIAGVAAMEDRRGIRRLPNLPGSAIKCISIFRREKIKVWIWWNWRRRKSQRDKGRFLPTI